MPILKDMALKRGGHALLIAGCLTAPAHAQESATPPLTLAQARSLPADELAELALRQLADQLHEVTRPTYDSLLVPGLPLTGLTFATSPRSGPYTGLCEATRVHVSFFDSSRPLRMGGDQSVRAQDVRADLVYKVIGEVEPQSGVGMEERRRQDSDCARLTQVIPPDDESIAQRAFFGYRGDLGLGYGIAALQRLVREVSAGTHTDHECVRTFQGCPDSTAVLRALSFDDLLSLGVERHAEDPNRYSVTGEFLVGGSGNALISDRVTVEMELNDAYPRQIASLGHTSIRRTTLIRD